jgi:UDP-galactopyranose mutase
VLLLEARAHIGGNAYDRRDESGILLHQYGPHIFHTDNERVFAYLSRFTAWRDYRHRVAASVGARLLPVPFNLTSLELAFGGRAPGLERKLLAAYGAGRKVGILELRENPDSELAEVAEYIYQNIFLRYTSKQWGQTPEEIDPATTARVPVFLSRDDGYFQEAHQGLPQEGYTPLFENLLGHPNITLLTHTPAQSRVSFGEDGVIRLDGAAFGGAVVYTGAIDELFSRRFGRLPYRTLDFRFETLDREWFQPLGTVNYTVSEDFTRITEFKHLTGQNHEKTTIVREYARGYTGAKDEIPYYAIISPANRALYDRYAALAAGYPRLRLLGRLAEYQYYNMDAIVARALTLADELLARTEHH